MGRYLFLRFRPRHTENERGEAGVNLRKARGSEKVNEKKMRMHLMRVIKRVNEPKERENESLKIQKIPRKNVMMGKMVRMERVIKILLLRTKESQERPRFLISRLTKRLSKRYSNPSKMKTRQNKKKTHLLGSRKKSPIGHKKTSQKSWQTIAMML
jgi:hypothetical protein